MTIELGWMRADAPYMPIATQGLLSVLEELDPGVMAVWRDRGGSPTLKVETALTADQAADAIVDASLPDVALPAWPTSRPQALGPSLRTSDDPLATYRALVSDAAPAERRLLRSVATEQVVDAELVPQRTRLLRGAKSDLSAFAPLRRTSAGAIRDELINGPDFLPGKSGTALGLVPELQTFGGTTGPTPADIGAESALLSRLLRHGILALPPLGAMRRGRRVVGGPLVTEAGDLSWPRWTIPCGIRELRALFCLAALHAVEPDGDALRRRGIDAVYRARPQALSTTVAVYRWGRRIT